MLIGLAMMDFPAKRGLLLKILQMPKVLSGLNQIRAKTGLPPFEVTEDFQELKITVGGDGWAIIIPILIAGCVATILFGMFLIQFEVVMP